MTPKSEVPKVIVTGANGRYLLACRACDWRREVFAAKATAHDYAERHRRRPHPKEISVEATDTIGTTDSLTVELTTPDEPPAA